MTAGVEGSVDPEDAALDNLRDRRPGVFGDGVPVPAVDQGVRGEDNVGSMSRRLTPFLATLKMWRCAFVPGAKSLSMPRSVEIYIFEEPFRAQKRINLPICIQVPLEGTYIYMLY